MKFRYYKKLKVAQKRIYDKSDSIKGLTIPEPERFNGCLKSLEAALKKESKVEVVAATNRIARGFSVSFNVPPVKVKILSKRPSGATEELHGLYELEEDKQPIITVWMRTAQRKQVVAFKTFLRTFIHEMVHHLDYAYLKLEDSFHTEGFYQRENSLMKQLMKELE